MTNLVELSVATPVSPNVTDVVTLAEMLVIDSQMTADMAVAEYRSVRDQIKLLEAERMKMKRPVIDAGRRIDDFFRPALDALERASLTWNRKISAHLDAQKVKQREAEARAREAARVERERLTKEAAEQERASLESAVRLRAEAAALAAEGNQGAAASLVTQADNAELAGQQDAQLTLERMEHTVAVIDAPAKPAGIAERQEWEVDYLDLMATVLAVAQKRAPLKSLQWDFAFCHGMANSLREEFVLPGCEARRTTTIALSGRRKANGNDL